MTFQKTPMSKNLELINVALHGTSIFRDVINVKILR